MLYFTFEKSSTKWKLETSKRLQEHECVQMWMKRKKYTKKNIKHVYVEKATIAWDLCEVNWLGQSQRWSFNKLMIPTNLSKYLLFFFPIAKHNINIFLEYIYNIIHLKRMHELCLCVLFYKTEKQFLFFFL